MVLTINVLIPRLSAVTVAVVTGTEGPAQTHIPVDSKSGLTSYDISYVNATDLHSVDKSRLRHWRRRLHPPSDIQIRKIVTVSLFLAILIGYHHPALFPAEQSGRRHRERQRVTGQDQQVQRMPVALPGVGHSLDRSAERGGVADVAQCGRHRRYRQP